VGVGPTLSIAGGVLAVVLLATVPPLAARSGALPRSEVDRADDRTGPQIHALYVVPSDGADRGYDTDGTVAASVANWQGWFRGQTRGPGLRLDTSGGELDVTFRRLSQTDAQLAARGVFIRDAIEQELKAAGFNQSGKIYAVYYDGSSTAACGGGAWPPTLPGNVGAVYLRATFGAGFPCYDATQSRAGLQLMDFAVLHEVLHTMGFVPTCAPRHTRAGHVSDSPSDLMYAGDQPWQPSALDVGNDDYYHAHRPGCLELAESLYLESNEPPAPPAPPAPPDPEEPEPTTVRLRASVVGPGRVRSTPSGIVCPRRCMTAFARGARVTLRATPAKRARFVGWNGACKGRSSVCRVQLTADRAVRARFRR
jgi:Divergent InlB B-repeat domain